MGSGPIYALDDLRAPISDVLSVFQQQMAELQRYKAKYGHIEEVEDSDDDDDDDDDQESEDGSDTE